MKTSHTLAKQIYKEVESLKVFDMDTLYQLFPKEKKTTIRGRVYRELMSLGVVKRESKGLYSFIGLNGEQGVIFKGDARNLSSIKNNSLDLIIADHPYEIVQGTNRSFNSNYKESTFCYEKSDFEEKARVLKDGAFLVEFLPEMKEGNLQYLFKIINFALDSGFKFYAKIPWYKAEIRNGKLVDGSAFVGRKAVMEDVHIFSKGSPRKLRLRKQGKVIQEEKGAAVMFPAVFIDYPILPGNRIHKAEKPESLIRKLISALTKDGEIVLDQFAGSLVTFFTALKMHRKVIAIELDEDNIENVLTKLAQKN